MITTALHASTPHSTLRPYVVRAAVSVLWAVLLAVTLATSGSSAPVPALVIALLVAYPIVDLVASLVELRERRSGASATPSLLVLNAAISVVTAVALGVAAGHSAGAALRVFGIWALLAGLIQLSTAVARRRSGHRGQWPMILSGSISAVAGVSFFQMGGHAEPALTGLAGYAVAGAVFLLIAVHRRRTPRDAEAAIR